MTSSGTSTERRRPEPGLQAWHFFVLLSMLAATAAVTLSPHTHPAALLLLSAAVVAAGLVGLAGYRALQGFFGSTRDLAPLPPRAREELVREKSLLLRSIKELEFDHAMGKVGEKDFGEISARLRARAIALMQELDRAPSVPAPPVADVPVPAECAACGTAHDAHARFCKQCGARLRKRDDTEHTEARST